MAGLFSKGGYTLKEFLMGSDSLGGLLEDEGYAAIPGVNRPGEGKRARWISSFPWKMGQSIEYRSSTCTSLSHTHT